MIPSPTNAKTNDRHNRIFGLATLVHDSAAPHAISCHWTWWMVLVVCFIFSGINAQAQRADHAYFGLGIGLRFDADTAVVLTDGAQAAFEGIASISDDKGNLLFYTDGITVYNRNHGVMLNGTGLAGGASAKQAALIVPWPDSPSLYAVFTAPQTASGSYAYSMVDMRSGGGLGAVMLKNVPLLGPGCETLTAVRQSNSRKHWIIGQVYGTGQCVAFPFTATGVGSPVFSTWTSDPETDTGQRMLRANGRGDRLAWQSNLPRRLWLADFDRSTGLVSNLVSTSLGQFTYGLEFSPDDARLYLTGNDGAMLQFDLQAGSTAVVFASVDTVAYWPGSIPAGIQLGPDGIVYISALDSFLSRIRRPDSLGSSCLPAAFDVAVPPNTLWYGLPNYLPEWVRLPRMNLPALCSGESFFPTLTSYSPVSTDTWIFQHLDSGLADTLAAPLSAPYAFATGGHWEVTAAFTRWGYSDTVRRRMEVVASPDFSWPADTILASGDSLWLNAAWPQASYSWSTGSSDSAIWIKEPGLYTVSITTAAQCNRTFQINVIAAPSGLGNTATASATVYPNPGLDALQLALPYPATGSLVAFSATGQKMGHWQVAGNLHSIDTRAWPAGIYLVGWTENGKNIQTWRWTKAE